MKRFNLAVTAILTIGGLLGWFAATSFQRSVSAQEKSDLQSKTSPRADQPDRTALPPAPPMFQGKIGKTYKDSTPDWNPALPLQAPTGAPNVIVIVLDDVGYGQLGCYGGPIQTPNIDRLAASGLRYNNFHTMALGKWHLAPYTAYTAAGPFDHWPLGMGFEKYYGFLGGETDQWAPLLTQDNHFIETPTRPGYHVTEDLVDHAIAYIRDQQQVNTGRPFFSYLALGACHAPLHAPKEYIEKYKGKFDRGWDKVREEVFERQKRMGIVPASAVLPPANPGIQAWADLNDRQRKVYCRLQETFAGFMDHADHHIGRLLTALDDLKIRDNTLIMLVSDNGASQEGLRDGTCNTDRYRNYFPDTVAEMIGHLDEIGSPATDPHYPMGWSMGGNSPLKRWKQDTHAGGNTDPFIVSWPASIKERGSIRNQYHHIVDVVPTLLEVAGLPAPTSVNGVPQMPLHGVSMAYTFGDANAPTRKKIQYYEMLGSRAIWSGGWTAVTWHKKDSSWDEDTWELYNTDEDFTQSTDLAAKHPEKLKELQDLWWAEAEKYNVLPLDDRRYERAADPTRPVAAVAKRAYTFYPGTSILHPLAAPQILGREHTITAFVEIPQTGAEGVLACSGGEFGGWTVFLKDGKLHYSHNYLKLKEYAVAAGETLSAGKHQLNRSHSPANSIK